jgi:hypothetical protein
MPRPVAGEFHGQWQWLHDSVTVSTSCHPGAGIFPVMEPSIMPPPRL